MTFAKTWQDAKQPAMDRGANCEVCPLRAEKLGPCMSELSPRAEVLITGAAPGKDEVLQGRPMVGFIGKSVRRSVAKTSVEPHQVSYTNVILCGVPGGDLKEYLDRLPSGVPSPLECCRPRFDRDINESNARTLVTLGSHALEAVGKHYSIPVGAKGRKKVRGEKRLAAVSDQRGHPFELPDRRWLLPTLLSSRGERQFEHVIDEDIQRGCHIAARGHKINWSPPEVLYDRPESPLTVDQIEAWLHDVPTGEIIYEDIETNGLGLDCTIRCIGIGRTDGRIIVVPLHHIGGAPYWTGPDMVRVWSAVLKLNTRCRVVFHNGAFDTERLMRSALWPDRLRLWEDTLLMHHDTRENDLPHRMAFVMTRFSEAPLHKSNVDHKADENEQRDEDLHYYCGLDIDTTRIMHNGLIEWLDKDQTWPQYEVDRQAQRIARDMGSLGHPIHEPTRAKISETLHGWLTGLTKQMQDIVGGPIPVSYKAGIKSVEFNPNSHEHVRTFLFKVKGHRPSLNTAKKAFEEGDKATTGIEGLFALQDELEDHGIDKQTDAFIKALIAQRSIEQLRKLYVDNLETIPTSHPEMRLLHPSFSCVLPTGRWSSSPNLQNWPSQAKINMKTMIRAMPGHVFVGSDFDQLELRLYAADAGDQYLLEEFAKGAAADPHSLNAAVLRAESGTEAEIQTIYKQMMHDKKHGDDKTKKMVKYYRNIAKRFAFLCIYGGERPKLYSTMRADRNKATGERSFPNLKPEMTERWYDLWHNAHPWTKSWQESVKKQCRRQGYVTESVHGRKRFFPGGPSKQNAPVNVPIQGAAGAKQNTIIAVIDEVIPHRGWSEWSGLFSTIHDFCAVQIPRQRADEAVGILNECMQSTYKGVAITASAVVSVTLDKQDEQLEVELW